MVLSDRRVVELLFTTSVARIARGQCVVTRTQPTLYRFLRQAMGPFHNGPSMEAFRDGFFGARVLAYQALRSLLRGAPGGQ